MTTRWKLMSIVLALGLGSTALAEGPLAPELDVRLQQWKPEQAGVSGLTPSVRRWAGGVYRERLLAEIEREIEELGAVDIERLSSEDPWDLSFRENMSRKVVDKVGEGFSEGLADYVLETTHLERRVEQLSDLTTIGSAERDPIVMKMGVSSALPSLELTYPRLKGSLHMNLGFNGLAELDYRPAESRVTRLRIRFDARESRSDFTCSFRF